MKATTLLVRQHRKIERLIDALRSQRHKRDTLLLQLMDELLSHLATEDSLFYPNVRRALDTSLAPNLAKHLDARRALVALTQSTPSQQLFAERLEALRAAFASHVALDEENLYHAVTSHLDEATLEDLGDDMETLSLALTNRKPHAVRWTTRDVAAE